MLGLCSQLITRFQVSTYYITHNANGFQCDVTGVGGRVVTTALEVNVNRTKAGKYGFYKKLWCVFVCTACVCLCVFQCVCMRACAASV